MDRQREDYADLDLPPARRPSRVGMVLAVLTAIVLIVVVGLPLLARLVVARMEWN